MMFLLSPKLQRSMQDPLQAIWATSVPASEKKKSNQGGSYLNLASDLWSECNLHQPVQTGFDPLRTPSSTQVRLRCPLVRT